MIRWSLRWWLKGEKLNQKAKTKQNKRCLQLHFSRCCRLSLFLFCSRSPSQLSPTPSAALSWLGGGQKEGKAKTSVRGAKGWRPVKRHGTAAIHNTAAKCRPPDSTFALETYYATLWSSRWFMLSLIIFRSTSCRQSALKPFSNIPLNNVQTEESETARHWTVIKV